MKAFLIVSEKYRGQFQFWTDDPYFVLNCPCSELLTDDGHIVNRDRVMAICEAVSKVYELSVSDQAIELIKQVLDEKEPQSSFFKPPFEGFQWKGYQRRAINVLEREDNAFLQTSPGTGKAQPNDEPVLTPSGWVSIGELKVGDIVYDGFGNETVVNGVFPRGKLEEYCVTFADGRKALCGGDHLWKCSNSLVNGDRRWHVRTTEDIIDKGVLRKSDGKARFCIPLNLPIRRPASDLPIDPYVLGVLIGDGALSQTAVTFSTNELDIAERVQARLGNDYWVHKYKSKNYSWGIVYGPSNYRNPLHAKIKELGLNVLSGEKFIPDAYKNSSVEQRRDLLAGLFDTDGSVNRNGRFSFSTTSEQLRDDIIELCLSLGYQSKYRVDDRPSKSSVCYEVWIGTNDRIFYSNKHNERFDKSIEYKTGSFHRYDSVKIKSIDKTGREVDMTCISVESDDHTYITRDYVVTHNSLMSTMMACQRYEQGRCGKIILWVPAPLIYDWVRNIQESTTLSVATPKRSWSAKKREEFYLTDDSDVWVLNYERVRTVDREPLEKALRKKRPLFVMDEVTKVKGRSSTVHKELAKLSRHCKATHIALSATPIVRGPEDFYNEFRIVDPDVFGRVRDFEHMFTYNDGEKDLWNNYVGYQNLAYMHVMTGAQVFSASKTSPEIAKEFPAKNETLITYRLSDRHRALYDEIFQYGRSLGRDEREGALFMMAYMRLCNMPQTLLLPHAYDDSRYSRQLRVIDEICRKYERHILDDKQCAKMELVLDKVREIVDAGEKVLVFAQHTANCLYPLGERMKKAGLDPLFYTGDVSLEDKERVKTAFKTDPNRQVLLMSDAGQVGLNFQECRYLIHYQTPISHAAYEQRSDRISRVDSEFETIDVMRFVGEGTFEERVEETMQGRRQMATEMGLGEYEEVGAITQEDADWFSGFDD